MPHARLPGYKPRRSYVERDERLPHTRTDAQLNEAILATLLNKPHTKQQLQSVLRESDYRLSQHLYQLRKAGKIKLVSKKHDLRNWALIDWIPDPSHAFIPDRTVKPETATTSWWLDKDRKTFNETLECERGRMRGAKHAYVPYQEK